MQRFIAFLTLALGPATLSAQQFPTDDPVIKRIWDEGMTGKSQVSRLAQVLMDSIGPRLTASPGHQSAVQWLQNMYQSWGVPARAERYGTWRAWKRHYTHMDLIAPRMRTLEAIMLAWSPGTSGPVEGDVVVAPDVADPAGFDAWLAGVKGKFIAFGPAEPSCRAPDSWEKLARPESVAKWKSERDRDSVQFQRQVAKYGSGAFERMEAAGALGILMELWSGGWGVDKVFQARTHTVPHIQLSCEDYGLVYRLASNKQGPRLRLDAKSEDLGEVPAFNVVAELKGTEKPDEYVLLSAHFDSWDAASGATDNGTGSVMMAEAMRILKQAYPNPKRTIVVGHWGGEEQGLIGSAAFAEDHPEVVRGMQAGMNHDNGTWRVEYIRLKGQAGATQHFGRWLSKVPQEIRPLADTDIQGIPAEGGSDHTSFLCRGAPAFRLQSHYPDYRQYTWHTNRDTYDKLVLDDLRNNATVTAMLAYQASEDPERVSRDQRTPPGCVQPKRSSGR